MYCVNCGKEVIGTTETIEEIARRVYQEECLASSKRIRAIARSECRNILKEQYETESAYQAPYERAGEKWTVCEDNILKKELADFFAKTAKDHRRSYGAIVSRIKRIYDKEY